VGILSLIIETKRRNLENMINKYGSGDPRVINESQLINKYIDFMKTYYNQISDKK
jgi:hypothetical protein